MWLMPVVFAAAVSAVVESACSAPFGGGRASLVRAAAVSARMGPIPVARRRSRRDDEVPDLVPERRHGPSRRGAAGSLDAAHAVVQEAKDAGVWVFGGGIDESVPPVMVDGDGTVTEGTYPQTKQLEGGYSVLELHSREAALEWAA